MNTPMIPVSWGELLDKISILTIKTQRLHAENARSNAARELHLLQQALPEATGTAELQAGLLAVNTRLWRIEDQIRQHETTQDFGPGFIKLARSVYRENDERGRIKQALNRKLQSTLVEEKQYPAY